MNHRTNHPSISTADAIRLLDDLTPEETHGMLMRLLGSSEDAWLAAIRDVHIVRAKQQLGAPARLQPVPAHPADVYRDSEYLQERSA